METTPVFLEVLEAHTKELTLDQYAAFYTRTFGRLNFGLKKYGKPLTTNDGRDSIQDAWEEAFDLCQYILKAYIEGKLPYGSSLVNDTVKILLQIECLRSNTINRECDAVIKRLPNGTGGTIGRRTANEREPGTTEEARQDENVSGKVQ